MAVTGRVLLCVIFLMAAVGNKIPHFGDDLLSNRHGRAASEIHHYKFAPARQADIIEILASTGGNRSMLVALGVLALVPEKR